MKYNEYIIMVEIQKLIAFIDGKNAEQWELSFLVCRDTHDKVTVGDRLAVSHKVKYIIFLELILGFKATDFYINTCI